MAKHKWSGWYVWTRKKRGAKRPITYTSGQRFPTYQAALAEVDKMRELDGDKYIYAVADAPEPSPYGFVR